MNAETLLPNRRNLLLLAAYMDALPPKNFDQTRFQHGDGSPSCLVAHMFALLEPETWERAKCERNPRFAREQTARLLGLDYGQTANLYCGRPLGYEAESPTAKDAATMLKRMAWSKNAGINWPPHSRWPGLWSGLSMSRQLRSELSKVAPRATHKASMGANRHVVDLSLREMHRDSGERVTKTKSADLYDRLKEALANFDLNELYDTYMPREPLDNFTQESIKRSAIEAAMRAILTDVNYWVVNEPPIFDDLTERIRRRVDAGGPPLNFHEAVETYQHAHALCEDGWQRLHSATAEDRDHEIALRPVVSQGLWTAGDLAKCPNRSP